MSQGSHLQKLEQNGVPCVKIPECEQCLSRARLPAAAPLQSQSQDPGTPFVLPGANCEAGNRFCCMKEAECKTLPLLGVSEPQEQVMLNPNAVITFGHITSHLLLMQIPLQDYQRVYSA